MAAQRPLTSSIRARLIAEAARERATNNTRATHEAAEEEVSVEDEGAASAEEAEVVEDQEAASEVEDEDDEDQDDDAASCSSRSMVLHETDPAAAVDGEAGDEEEAAPGEDAVDDEERLDEESGGDDEAAASDEDEDAGRNDDAVAEHEVEEDCDDDDDAAEESGDSDYEDNEECRITAAGADNAPSADNEPRTDNEPTADATHANVVVNADCLRAGGYGVLESDSDQESDYGDDGSDRVLDTAHDWVGSSDSESDAEEDSIPIGELPDSEYLARSRDKNGLREMAVSGWETGAYAGRSNIAPFPTSWRSAMSDHSLFLNKDANSFPPDVNYPSLSKSTGGPSTSALRAAADCPLAVFLYFMPITLWRKIALEANRYHKQRIAVRAERIQQQQRKNQKGVKPETKAAIRARLRLVPAIESHEYLQVVGLLIARMLWPHRQRLAKHWSPASFLLVTFGKVMSLNRYQYLMQHLHFTDNNDERSTTDRAWKVRSGVDCMQATFRRGHQRNCPMTKVSFRLGRTSTRLASTKRQAPQVGHEAFYHVLCNSCVLPQVYCGKHQHQATELDNHAGAATVVRNVDAVLPVATSDWHVVVTDRFYTSVQQALQLLHRDVYLAGTIMTNRICFPKSVVKVKKKKEKDRVRGVAKIAVAKAFPCMIALAWIYLGTGGGRTPVIISRRVRGGAKLPLRCPSCLVDYQRWMGGVNVHDRPRLQRYSFQLACRGKKYYKTIFLGLLDVALVNAFIVYREYNRMQGLPAAERSTFLNQLHQPLIQVTAEDFATMADDFMPPKPSRKRPQTSIPGPCMVECPDIYVAPDGRRKRLQRACKVCSLLSSKGGDEKRKTKKDFCDACSEDDRNHWACGNKLPPLGSRIQMRKPGKKRSRREVFAGDEEKNAD
ncbi:TPA: LOW QUALITY PROTEIN: hypothetical protein N0F65_002950 [Lagenidium giganteum]|uniref:PiggyBac transposable element-derived protein domain-containing protein n=1 Tax=Lagenidium giganteum TaxID=4803 RepID=A0AAV2Z8I6_9STRA|nr:TPA: LOW QUALITY PROTEIN: hypothetical protein N0F65_002950 [Lagenidium giganteum]